MKISAACLLRSWSLWKKCKGWTGDMYLKGCINYMKEESNSWTSLKTKHKENFKDILCNFKLLFSLHVHSLEVSASLHWLGHELKELTLVICVDALDAFQSIAGSSSLRWHFNSTKMTQFVFWSVSERESHKKIVSALMIIAMLVERITPLEWSKIKISIYPSTITK